VRWPLRREPIWVILGFLLLCINETRPEHLSGRAEFGPGRKNFLFFRAEKILPMTIPLDISGLNFRAGPGLGRDARTFYSVKQLNTAFRAGLGPKKNFAGFKISAHARPIKFVGGPGAGRARAGPGRAGLKMLRYKWNIINPENKPKLQNSCPLKDLNLRPLEQNWSALTTKTRTNLCYIGVFTSFYQWNIINPKNKPKLQKSCPLRDLNQRPLEQNWDLWNKIEVRTLNSFPHRFFFLIYY
jgi:hypothetical protein